MSYETTIRVLMNKYGMTYTQAVLYAQYELMRSPSM